MKMVAAVEPAWSTCQHPDFGMRAADLFRVMWVDHDCPSLIYDGVHFAGAPIGRCASHKSQ